MIENQYIVGDLSTISMHSRDACHVRKGFVDTMFVTEPGISCLERFNFQSDIMPSFDIPSQVNIS